VNSVALRIQRSSRPDQVLVLGHLAQLRSASHRFAPRNVAALYDELVITPPSNISSVLALLERDGFLARKAGTGEVWAVSPAGRERLLEQELEGDLPTLLAEIEVGGATLLGGMVHPLLPPRLAPPELAHPLKAFLEEHPFETNVFGMTRFPTEDDIDPVGRALITAREVCAQHGLEFHLASDRAIVDNLWSNISGHMWASKYGLAFFEDRGDRGINYNMTIEVGSMLMAGRRCALLKEDSIQAMPTDLVGHIYKAVNLDDSTSIADALHIWIRDDLDLGRCSGCP